MYTFYFLYSSCGCSSKGLPAIWGLTVSVSTTLKVTLQPTSEVGSLSPGVCMHLCTIFSPPFLVPPFFQWLLFLHTFREGGSVWWKGCTPTVIVCHWRRTHFYLTNWKFQAHIGEFCRVLTLASLILISDPPPTTNHKLTFSWLLCS